MSYYCSKCRMNHYPGSIAYEKHRQYDVARAKVKEIEVRKPTYAEERLRAREAITGEEAEIVIRVPVGVRATPFENNIYNDVFAYFRNSENWKLETSRERVSNKETAVFISQVLQHFLGGAEIVKVDDQYEVGSLGYYHYIGA